MAPPLFRLLLWTHWKTFTAWLHSSRRNSPLLLWILAALVVGYLVIGYLIFHAGLNYLYHFPLVGSLLSQRMLFLIYGFFFVMLIPSNLIIGYSTMFQNRETAWMLTLPIPHRHIYRWKFFEALVVSSWALMFLSAPLMLAYGQVREVGPLFYVEVALLYLPFVTLPALIGSWSVLFVARLFAQRSVKRAMIFIAVAALVGIMFGIHPVSAEEAVARGDTFSVEKLLQHTQVSLNPYLPSAWVTRSILAWSDGLQRQGDFFFLLLLSNALMGLVFGFELIGRFFYGSWVATLSARARAFQQRADSLRESSLGLSWLDRAVGSLRRYSPPGAALVLKDIRLFWRDPTQWTQFLIFFGLLCIYVLNLRNVSSSLQSAFWEIIISYLNLGACALTLSTLTTRFVYPQFSLEGRRIWLLGLAPFGLNKVVLQKFWMAAFVTGAITSAMMVTSSLELHLPAAKIVFFGLAILLMSATLSGMAVGLGALFPNFKEDNPSKIVSGFGGTLCLVVSFIYITLFITLAALPDVLRSTGLRSPVSEMVTWPAAIVLSLFTLLFCLLTATRRVKSLEI